MRTALFVVALVLALDAGRPAYAYLDPGTGSMILQLLLGAIAAGLVTIKIYWQRLKGFFARRRADHDGSHGKG